MKCQRVAVILLLFTLMPVATVMASHNIIHDNLDPSGSLEYGSSWFDVDYLDVYLEGIYLNFVVHYADGIPASQDYVYYPYIFLDTDGDNNYDYIINLHATGDGSGIFYDIYDADENVWWTPPGMELLYEPGGDCIGARLPLYVFDVMPGQYVCVYTDGYSYMDDYVFQNFSYTVGASNAVTVDGDPSDWPAMAPSFWDPFENHDPLEFDWRIFYTTDDGNLGDGHIYHRFDVEGATTTSLNPGEMMMWRSLYFYYDVDQDGTYDYFVSLYYVLDAQTSRYIVAMFYYWTGSGWYYDHDLDATGWDWGATFESAIPLSDLGVGSGTTIDVIVVASPEPSKTLPSISQDQYPPEIPEAKLGRERRTGMLEASSSQQHWHESVVMEDPAPLDFGDYVCFQVPAQEAVGGVVEPYSALRALSLAAALAIISLALTTWIRRRSKLRYPL